VLAVVIAAIAVAVSAIWLLTSLGSGPETTGASTAEPGAPESTPAPTKTPAPTPEPVTGDLDESSADVVLANYFDAVDTLTEDDDLNNLTTVVSGNAFDELQAQLLEFESREWTVTGETRYEDVKILESDLEAKTPTALVSVCVDSSDVTVVGTDGKPVGPKPVGERRAINLYSLTYTDDAWRIVSHSFPDNPQC
jgi:hypothetical protein